MTKNLFSVPIFFIVFRETLEAAIIVSVLLGLVEQIVHEDPGKLSGTTTRVATRISEDKDKEAESGSPVPAGLNDDDVGSTVEAGDQTEAQKKQLIRKLRVQIFLGTGVGLLIALGVGAAFIAVWFTQASNLWSKSEEIWEGTFELVAAIMIFVMGITMLKMDRAKAVWRIKLTRAFEGKQHIDKATRSGKWVLFILPMVTVLREGMEAVIFVGGVSLGQPAESIPIAAIVGLICGFVCGFVIYMFASRTTLTIFLVVMTNFLMLIGAGLFTKSVSAYLENDYNTLLGQDVDDKGAYGPGAYDVRGNVWYLPFGNPEAQFVGQGWTIFNAIFGWTNDATVGSVLAYVFYWLAVIASLVFIKFKEGRTKLFKWESRAGKNRRAAREAREAAEAISARDGDDEKAAGGSAVEST
ncbi:Ftr1 protein [Athelia psychrophila]|uniref:Ftr1 protein n=1 Tax=Athelia psychrophila TaxID=1759441 RepID=A0A166DFC8_9AGAM|nr:Ftr1 protein [Fibularhizoctonia sp. CBS 109695]